MATSPDPSELAETWPADPVGSEPLDPADVLSQQSAALGGDPAAPAREPVIIGRVPAIDFENRRFRPATSGGPLMITGREALQQRVQKCLTTRRGDAPACHPDFGVERTWQEILGGPFDAGAVAEFEDYCTRALLRDPAFSEVIWGGVEGGIDSDTAFVYLRVLPALEGSEPIDARVAL